MTDALETALARNLDRFDVPPLSAGLADRIAAAATTPTAVPFSASRRDRRGMWRRGRQVALGTLAAGMLSAAAVASGLLGSVGIEVPVLTAMFAPKPKPAAKPAKPVPKLPVTRTAAATPSVVTVDPAPSGIVRPMLPAERQAMRQERRERREAFAAAHPVAAAVIRERVREQLQRRALARRQALMTPPIDSALPGAGGLELADRAALARAARRDRLAAERMIDRRIQAREARIAEKQAASITTPVAPPVVGDTPPSPALAEAAPQARPNILRQPTPEQREARRARIQQMSPEQRAVFRERMQQRRAARLGRQSQN